MIDNMTFHRLFSKTLYKNLKLQLGEMTFSKDFVNTTRGDLYPVISNRENCFEYVSDNQYCVKNGAVERMFTAFFPFASYEITFSLNNGMCGFIFHLPGSFAEIIYDGSKLSLYSSEFKEEFEFTDKAPISTMIVTCRRSSFDVYFIINEKPTFIHTFDLQAFNHSNVEKVFQKGYVSVIADDVVIHKASSYMDSGVSLGDIRMIRYENGDVIFENGVVYFTASIRMEKGAYQGIFSWVPSTDKIELCGALFFDSGDGCWHNYIAASLLYNRNAKQWYIWTVDHISTHTLCYGAFDGEPRFGVNIIDVTLMSPANGEDITDFVAFNQDEDPDFYYNEDEKKWYMAICRICPTTKHYRYMFYKSDNPFDGYEYIGRGYEGAETGGSFVNIGGEMAFICGNDFHKRANYRIYTKDAMHEAKFDFDDGGFRGWGTVIPVSMGSRKRYFWLSFDRHNGSDFNWSYGNIYCFEGIL